MQLPKCFRRGIVVPRNLRAAEQLRSWHVLGSALVEYLPLDESLFDAVWQSGVFQAINEVCSGHINDFEEEVIQPEDLPAVIDELRRVSVLIDPKDVRDFVEDLVRLCHTGRVEGMPVYFIL